MQGRQKVGRPHFVCQNRPGRPFPTQPVVRALNYIHITTIENLLLFWGVRNEVVLLEFPWIWRMYFWCTFFSLVVGRRRKPDRILMGYFSRKCRKFARYFTMSIVPVLYRLPSFLIAILIINGAKVCSGCSYIKTVLKIKHMGCIYIFRTFTSSYISYL